LLEHNLSKGGLVVMTTHQEMEISAVTSQHLVLS